MSSPNHGERRGGARPRLVVLHFTGMDSFAAARARLCDPVHEVSAHWLLDVDGRAEALVEESRRAWHAGAGSWGGTRDVNSSSIGIEIQNPGDRPFPAAQMAALETLLAAILDRWAIAPKGVIAHSDMAPTRKRDPGPHFDWRRLARSGLSIWPQMPAAEGGERTGLAPVAGFAADARRFGYPDVPDEALLHAFRLRFRPWARGPLEGVDAALARDLAQRYPADPIG